METALLDRLGKAHATLTARLAPTLAAEGVTAAEWQLLRASLRIGAAAPSVLATTCGLTRGGVTRLVDRLRARRMLVRAGGGRDDRRYQTIALTGAGALLARRLRDAEAGAEAAMVAPLNPRQCATLGDLLDMLA